MGCKWLSEVDAKVKVRNVVCTDNSLLVQLLLHHPRAQALLEDMALRLAARKKEKHRPVATASFCSDLVRYLFLKCRVIVSAEPAFSECGKSVQASVRGDWRQTPVRSGGLFLPPLG